MNDNDGIPQIAGMWFHSFMEDGKIQYQGQICSVSYEYCVVQFYDFFIGAPSNKKLVPLIEVTKWNLYEDNEEMIEAYKERGNE